ncbi:MAG: 2-oxoacid:acceptor oxidoreductase family protein [Parcubacteria group bacterium]|nr:2-oxoacid:acceptor oxidoreductase family protein [Parcubacteria group bacterium]
MERFSICLHGLGGQGLKSMIGDILAPLISEAGFEVQAFPFFGGERRGAPVSGYLRCGTKKITTHSFISNPDMVVIFDHERISVAKALENLKPGGIALINTAFPNQFLGLTRDWRIYTLNARAISLLHGIGNPEDPYMVINSAMAGAVLKILEPIFKSQLPDKTIEAVLNNVMPQKILENYEALLEGKKTVVGLMADASAMWQWLLKRRAIPHLTQPDEHCTKCNLCYLFCPKRAIETNASGAYIIDEEKCNYCGICVTLCPRNAIAMII